MTERSVYIAILTVMVGAAALLWAVAFAAQDTP